MISIPLFVVTLVNPMMFVLPVLRVFSILVVVILIILLSHVLPKNTLTNLNLTTLDILVITGVKGWRHQTHV